MKQRDKFKDPPADKPEPKRQWVCLECGTIHRSFVVSCRICGSTDIHEEYK
jgi:rubrerythrin